MGKTSKNQPRNTTNRLQNPEKQNATLKRWKRIEGPNPIPHPKERQRTGEAVSNRHTGNSVIKTLDRRKAKGQYDQKEVQKPLVSGGFLVTFSAAKKSLRPQAEAPVEEI